MQNFEKVHKLTQGILSRLGKRSKPRLAVILGTGLGGLAEEISNPLFLNYSDITGFPLSTVSSHQGRFVFGDLNGVELVIQQGRFHLYEGYSPAEVCLGVRVMHGLGAESLIVTNAAGCLDPQWEAGSLMLITDHINFTGHSPLTGPNYGGDPGPYPRFPDMAKVYDREYMDFALQEAKSQGLRLERGVYIALPGPELETPAETRAYRMLGADAVGMSTVLEAIVARHLNMRVLGLSCLSNKNLPDCMGEVPFEEIVRVAQEAGPRISVLVKGIIRRIGDQGNN